MPYQVNDHHVFYPELDLERHRTDLFSAGSDPSVKNHYRLYAVLVRVGAAAGQEREPRVLEYGCLMCARVEACGGRMGGMCLGDWFGGNRGPALCHAVDGFVACG